MISAYHRFHGHGSLKYIFSKGQTYRGQYLVLRAIANKRKDRSRVAVVVSKKVIKSAVGRNRIRRRLYHIIRPMLAEMNGVYDTVMIATNPELRDMDHDLLKKNVRELYSRAGLFGKSE